MITIGKITKPFGKNGALNVIPLTDFPERFYQLKKITLDDDAGNERVVEVESVRRVNEQVMLKLKGIDTVQDAERFRNMFLLIQPGEAFPLPKDRHYIFEIVGLDVMTQSGVKIGVVQDVMTLESNDVYVVQGERGEVLIPATKEIVKEINIEDGKIIIHPVEGLFTER
ncbi:MAG: 16S rRNA processing protein RimM [Gemmatimonadota bacterium]|nr:MAG: 16S rRNA processing protein RimM [Gemmatimonadota bacterium]